VGWHASMKNPFLCYWGTPQTVSSLSSTIPVPHSDSARRGSRWCPLESDCGSDYRTVSGCGEGGDGGTGEREERVPLIFWSTDTSTFGIVWLQTASAVEAEPRIQRPLRHQRRLARKS
jgi:hypothetical protein